MKRSRLRAAAMVAGALLGVACEQSTRPDPGSGWAGAAFGDAVVWSVDDSAGGWTMRPETDDRHVYFERDKVFGAGGLAAPAHLVAIDRASGATRWARPIVSAQNAAVSGDLVGAIWGGLEVFSRSSGALQYRFVYPGTSLSGNVVSSEGRFYFQTHSGRVVAVDAASGAVRWDTNLAGNALTTGFGLTLAGETLIATLKYLRASATGRDTGIVAALDAATGAVRWRVVIDPDSVTESGVVHPAVVWGNNVIVVTFSHEVFSFDLTTGAVRWRFDAAYGEPRVGNGGLAGCDGRVIVPTGDLGLVALDAATGAVLWKLPDIKEGSLSWVYCSHGTVLAGRLRVFAALSGASLARRT